MRLAELLIGPLRDPQRAIRIVNEARSRFPQVPEFTYLLALAQREAKRPEEAIATFEEALHEAGNASPPAAMANARFYFDYAIAADQAGLHDKAADLLRQSITLDPTTAAEAWNYLGYMWAEQNSHLDEAEDAVQHALQLDPHNGAYLDSLGWVYFRRGKFQEALDKLLLAAQLLDRSDPVVFEHIGDACAKLNRMTQALGYWHKALALSKDNKALAEKIDHARTKLSKGLPVKREPL
jgi:tetratricopeptide (TPR) repeat protein